MQSKKKIKSIGVTVLYCRLSRDDGMEGNGNSVANQKKLLQKYTKENDFANTKFYVDSADGENELAPFRNVMNEMYARDISCKVRSLHRIRGDVGAPLSQPPYGYMKSPDNPKFWIIDEEAAQVVRSVFKMCIEGKGNETIARILQENKALVPMAYCYAICLARLPKCKHFGTNLRTKKLKACHRQPL